MSEFRFSEESFGKFNKITAPKIQTSKVENNKSPYGEILHDSQNIFHGIGFDFIRLKGILEKGILSEEAAREEGISLARNYGGYNLKNYVSMAESPSINNSFDFGCFGTFIKDGISFVVKKENTFKAAPGSSMDSGFVDEIFVRNRVKREDIVGVMVPSELLDTPIRSLPFGTKKMGTGFVDGYCRKTLVNLENETGYKNDGVALEELIEQKTKLENGGMGYFERSKEESKIIDKMGEIMSGYLSEGYSKKLGKENPTLRDVLSFYLPPEMKIYDQNGFESSLSTIFNPNIPEVKKESEQKITTVKENSNETEKGISIEECVKKADQLIEKNGACLFLMDLKGSKKYIKNERQILQTRLINMIKDLNAEFDQYFPKNTLATPTREEKGIWGLLGDGIWVGIDNSKVIPMIVEHNNQKLPDLTFQYNVAEDGYDEDNLRTVR